MVQCQYCKKIFKRRNNLIKHQSTAKYCINLQNSPFECEYCKIRLGAKRSLKQHYPICIEYKIKLKMDEKDVVINLLKDELADLKDRFERLTNRVVDKPTTTKTINKNTTNILNNMVPLSEEHFAKFTDKLTIEHVNQGAEGYAQYALDHPLKNNIHYADKSRHILKYKNSEGSLVTDNTAVPLTRVVLAGIKHKNYDLIDTQVSALIDERQTIIDSGGMHDGRFDECIELAKKINELSEIRTACMEIEDRTENKFGKKMSSTIIKG